MASDLGLYLTSINKTKINVMRDPKTDPVTQEAIVKGYPAFLIRRLLSYHSDAVLYANELNMRPYLENQLQYEYFLHALPTKSRFAKTHKEDKIEHLDAIKKLYNYSDEKALEALLILTPKQIADIETHMAEGGVIKGKK